MSRIGPKRPYRAGGRDDFRTETAVHGARGGYRAPPRHERPEAGQDKDLEATGRAFRKETRAGRRQQDAQGRRARAEREEQRFDDE